MILQPNEPGVAGAAAALEEAGYVASFRIEGDVLVCSSCRAPCPPGIATIDYLFRFEGPSDPDEEAIVFGLKCGHCSSPGTLVSSYGPMLDPQEASLIAALVDARSSSSS